ncbi:MAG: hypothetical protein H0V70_27710 [Ktedonobacteraceae bacterium]|nr:hypothetical protein [Ktedonobacteraceae bacterium]
MTTTPRPNNPYAVIDYVSPEVSTVFAEYLESAFTLGDVLRNKPATLRQQVLTELSVYFDVRHVGEHIDLYFKKEQ